MAGLRRLEGLQWAIYHGVGERAPWLMLRAGFNGGNHNHRDLGNLVLGYGPDRVLADAGYGAGATAVHTAVTCGGDQTIDATAPLVRSRELPGGCYLACDLEACYPHRLAWHRRHVLLLPGGQLLVVDDLRGRHGRRPSARSHVLSDLPAVAEDHDVVFNGAAGRYRLRPLVAVLPPAIETWSHHHEHHRIELRTAVDRVHTHLAWILGPDDELLRGASWEHDGLQGTLRLGDQRAVIDLARGDLVEAGDA